ncbi:hypothetical protein [Pedobacter sp. BMA]|uniref:hypothetical protein n=1 Tax=Pedobacter sp. BMA TaxID=1663685 RepID=UPI0018CE94A1|nr:hypothetical protein [Pedobacter sp. BMA]
MRISKTYSMDKETVIRYIENGLETELLDKLDSFAVSALDKRFWNLVGILVILQEKAKIDWYQPNQALVKLVVNALPELLEDDQEKLTTLFDTLRKNAVTPYVHLSYFCRQFIIGIGDKDPQIVNSDLTAESYQIFITKLQSLNLSLLKSSIADADSEHNDITGIFYHNVDRLVEHRRTIITDGALEVYREYISQNPYAYLENYIRPYWTGTSVGYVDHYYHVPEPFQAQIFNDKFPWEDFTELARIKDVSVDLIEDLIAFQKAYNDRPVDTNERTVILFSNEMSNLSYGMPRSMVKLQSTEHKAVRKECLPPEYSC